MGNAKTDINVSPVAICFFLPGGCGGFTLAHGFSDRTYPDGFIGGGQIGYNWQYSPLIVVGLEADIQGALERDSATLTHSFSDFPSAESSNTAVTSYTTKIDWFGTVRGRVGYVWGNGEVLTYVTGGLAYGEVKINGTNTSSFTCFTTACFPLASTGSVTQSFGASKVNTGWVLGYGTEGRLATPGWTWRVESYYMDLGHLNTAGVTSGSSFSGAGITAATGGQVTTQTHFTDWVLRGGLNYQFH